MMAVVVAMLPAGGGNIRTSHFAPQRSVCARRQRKMMSPMCVYIRKGRWCWRLRFGRQSEKAEAWSLYAHTRMYV